MHSAPTPVRSAHTPVDAVDASALRFSDSADRVGMVGSVLCAIHCAIVPLVVSALPALGLGVFASADLDQGFALFATVLGFSTLLLGYRRHRAFRALALLIPGLSLVLIGSFSPLHDHSAEHAVLMVCGGLLIAAAHLLNMRLTHQAGSQHKRVWPASETA